MNGQLERSDEVDICNESYCRKTTIDEMKWLEDCCIVVCQVIVAILDCEVDVRK